MAVPDLNTDPISTLAPLTDEWGGSYRATTVGGQDYAVLLATRHQARPERGALAAYRLARVLGFSSVPLTARMDVPIGTLGQWLSGDEAAHQALGQKALVSNDGTVRILLQRQCSGRAVTATEGPDVERWARLAASTEPIDAANAPLVRGYVEMVVLDYLAGNVARRTLQLDETSRRICLLDQRDAFPGFLAPQAWQVLLERVRPIVRFPRGLAEALERLDRIRAEAELRAGRFNDWLVGPRDIADLTERRTTLLTLVHARIDQVGPDVAESLGP